MMEQAEFLVDTSELALREGLSDQQIADAQWEEVRAGHGLLCTLSAIADLAFYYDGFLTAREFGERPDGSERPLLRLFELYKGEVHERKFSLIVRLELEDGRELTLSSSSPILA